MRDSKDTVHTLGLGFAWTAIPNKLDIDFDYSFSMADTDYSFDAGSALQPVEDTPTLSSDRHTVQIAADWRLAEDRRLRLAYLFEYYDADDWALDGVGVNTNPRQLTFGSQAADYTANVIGVSYVMNW